MRSVLALLVLSSSGILCKSDFSKKSDYISKWCEQPGHIALTFDQGPSVYTGRILDALEQKGVRATFHPSVTNLDDYGLNHLRRAADRGHVIGVTVDLKGGGQLSPEEVLEKINDDVEEVEKVIRSKSKVKFLRIPAIDELSVDHLQLIKEHGYIVTAHSLDSSDYQYPRDNANIKYQIQDKIDKLGSTKGSYIILFLDHLEGSADATLEILDYLIEKEYKPVGLDECIGIEVDKMDARTNSTSSESLGYNINGVSILMLLGSFVFSLVAN